MRAFIVFTFMVMINAVCGNTCSTWDNPPQCFENNCVWYTKKCVPCEDVDRRRTCRRKEMCRWDDKEATCSTRMTEEPTSEPTMSPTAKPTVKPTPEPTWAPHNLVDCRDITRKKKCNNERHCLYQNGACCFLDNPDEFCKTRKRGHYCRYYGCTWDKKSRTCN